MYRIPAGLNLNDILGSEISQICMGKADVQFRFGSGTCIAVQSKVDLLDRGAAVSAWHPEDQWSTTAFQRILGLPIEGYAVLNDRLLEIRIGDGLVLHLHDDSDQFESMQIYPQGSVTEQIII